MLKLGIGIDVTTKRFAAGVSYEPETLSYLNALPIVNDSTLYFIATPQQITGAAIWTAVNTFVTNLKNTLSLTLGTNNLNTIFQAIYPFIGDTALMQKWNLVDAQDTNAAYRLVFAGGVVHSSIGITPNGTNAYANTFYNNRTFNGGGAGTNVDIGSLGYYSRNNTTSTNVLMGVSSGSVSFRLVPNFTNTFDYSQINTGLIGTAFPARTDKFIFVTRVAQIAGVSDMIKYRDGVQYANATTNTSAMQTTNADLFLFAANDGLGNANTYTTHACSLAYIGKNILSTQATDFNTAVQTLQTSLLRQV